MIIRNFEHTDAQAVLALWELCGLTRPWNDPIKDIERKCSVGDGFIVGEVDGEIVSCAMFAYDGHRGSVNYFAVHPSGAFIRPSDDGIY